MATESRVREPQQERSRKSLERVMEAGVEVLAEDGWHGFTLARVCERAGVTVGMLYRRFHGRDELLAAIQDRWLTTMEQSQEELTARELDWAGLEPAEAVRVAVEGIVEGIRDQEKLARVIDQYSSYDDGELRRMAQVSHNLADWYRDGLMHHAAVIVHPDPVTAVDFSFRIILDTTIRRTTHGDTFATGRGIGDWDAFTGELTRVCRTYLLARGADA